jgi:hypothetical protein
MTITYTFKINKIEIAPILGELSNVVTRVRYDYKGVDENGVEGIFSGVTPMPAPGSNDFKPLSELTEEDVISWLEVHADKPHMHERIAKQIAGQIEPMHVEAPLPWAIVEEVVEPVVESDL